MDSNVDTVREALELAKSELGYHIAGIDSSAKTWEAIASVNSALAALSTIDQDANATKVGHYFCAQMPCSPSDCTEVPCRYMSDAIVNRNNRDPDANLKEPSKGAMGLAYRIRELDEDEGIVIWPHHTFSLRDAAALITAHDDAIRRECARVAMDKMQSFLIGSLSMDDYIASILATEPAQDDVAEIQERIRDEDGLELSSTTIRKMMAQDGGQS